MTRRVYITGAAGTGVSSLGRALAQRLHASHADVDDSYWHDQAPLFSRKRSKADRLALIRAQMGSGGWVISGALEGWGDALLQQVDLIVFLMVPTPIRIDRIRRRERSEYGRRVLPGGDLCQAHEGLIRWAARYDDPDFAGRNMYAQEQWLADQVRPVLRLGGTLPVARLVQKVVAHKTIRRSDVSPTSA